MVPNKIYIVKGVGLAPLGLSLLAFDRALVMAGIGNLNHLRVSSVIPPGAQLKINEQVPLLPGTLATTVYSEAYGSNGVFTACLAFATPKDAEKNGMIFEISGAQDRTLLEARAILMAERAMLDRGTQVEDVFAISVSVMAGNQEDGCAVVAAVML